jgi:hypothetical protein
LDDERFTDLFTRFHGRILDYAVRRVGPDVAQDIVAEVFSTAWRHLHRVPDDALPWLYRTAWHAIGNHHRSTGRAGPAAPASTPAPSAQGHEDGGAGCFRSSTQPDGEPSPPPPPAFGVGYEAAGRPLPPLTYVVTVHTTMAAITSVAVVYADGHHIPLAFNRATGWAVGIVPAALSDRPGRIQGQNAAGEPLIEQKVGEPG